MKRIIVIAAVLVAVIIVVAVGSKSGVTLADVDNFGKAFRKIPKARQDECVHRALNLIPDELPKAK
jgi:hypothetical protein